MKKRKLIHVLNFLHKCLMQNTIIDQPQDLENNNFEINFLKGKTINDLTEIRDNLFKQLETLNN